MLSSDQEHVVMLNKRQLAKKLNVSLPTLSAWMDRWPEFPIEEQGTNGSSYKFDAAKVFSFLEERRQEELERKEQQDQKLTSLQLTFDQLLGTESDDHPTQSTPLSPKAQIEIWKLRQLKRKEAERCGKLVIADEVRDQFATVFACLGAESRAFIRRFARDNNLPPPIAQQVEQSFDDMQRSVVTELLSALNQQGDEHERHLDLNAT